MRWIPYVMVRVFLFFTAGILLAVWYPRVIKDSLVVLIFLLSVVCFLVLRIILVNSYWRGTALGCVALIAVCSSGYLMLVKNTLSNRKDHLSNATDTIRFYTGYAHNIEDRINSTKLELTLTGIFNADKWKEASGKILVQVSDSLPFPMDDNDYLMIAGTPQLIPPPENPEEFDFRKYLSQKNISHQHRVSGSQIIIISQNTSRGVIYWSQCARKWSASIIKKWIPVKREQAITMALVLGVTDSIDNDLQDAYSASGAMHVLSVSGLHVGIIYAIILLLLKPITTLAWGRWVVAGISLSCLWGYAFVTGLSPSVMRAVLMFSFVVLARPFGRSTNIYNTLAASAFLLLMFNPLLIMSVGFQLSYLAVLGIVYLQRPLYQLWEPRYVLWDKLWQLTTVSIAAQLATCAVSLFYFHQFPVYFLISNMLVIPVSTAVLVSGVTLLAVSSISYFAGVVGWITSLLVKILNGCVFFIENLPLSTIQNIQISAWQCWILMTITVTGILLFKERKMYYLYVTMSLGMAFSMLGWWHFIHDVRKDQVIIYNLAGHEGLVRIEDGRALILADSALRSDKRKIKYHIQPFLTLSGVRYTTFGPVLSFNKLSDSSSHTGFRFYLFNGVKILCIDKLPANLPSDVDVDYLIVGNNSVASILELKDKIHFKELILTRTNTRVYTKRMRKQALSDHCPVHSVQDNGALIINLRR